MFFPLDPSGSPQRVLVLAPHTDDGEFGCGGTMAKLIESGCEVYYVAFSSCEASVPDGHPKDVLKKEVKAACAKLGIAPNNLILHEFPVRRFPEFRQDILEVMVQLNSTLAPTLVLLPNQNDTHQDHNVISHEGFRAFKKTSMLGYELPWNSLTLTTTGFVILEEPHLKLKVDAVKCYESQSFRGYAGEEFVRSLAITRGTQIGCRYAEVFEVTRWIIS